MPEASYATTQGGQQVLILRGGSTQSRGRRAQSNNILAAKMIAGMVKTSLGPRGMDKMLVDSMGDVTITNDGATMLKDMDIQHPAGKMIIEIAKAVDDEVGDGTTTSVVLAGALLEHAEELIEKGVHPMVIINGYSKAAIQAQRILDDISVDVEPDDRATLTKVARTSMASKMVSRDSAALGALVVDTLLQIVEKTAEGEFRVDLDDLKVEKKVGGSLRGTSLIRGIILDKEVVH
jgi:chaperonin GroEL (HSP60 family)